MPRLSCPSFPRLQSPLPSTLSPAYLAALALIAIQVGIGILYKAAQSGGKYSFSASSSTTISEFLKLLISTGLFYRECIRRPEFHWTNQDPEYEAVTSKEDVQEEEKGEPHGSEDHSARSTSPHSTIRTLAPSLGLKTGLERFLSQCIEEVPTETKYGFAQLALFYALINNTVFVLYRLADPGTIQLIKSGTTLITALVMYCFLGTKIVRGQWLAILLQVCGIVVTQFDSESGAAQPLATYVVLLFQTSISAVSSVYNQTLCKSSDASLHAMNMNLYGAGVCVNLFIHALTRVSKPGEPGFFEGYGHTRAVMVIISNTFLGLIMTAVYKCEWHVLSIRKTTD